MQEYKARPFVNPKNKYLLVIIISIFLALIGFVLGYVLFINIIQLLCFILFSMVWAARHLPSLIISDTEIVCRNSHTVYWHFPISDYSHTKRSEISTLIFNKEGKSYELLNNNFTDQRWQEIKIALREFEPYK